MIRFIITVCLLAVLVLAGTASAGKDEALEAYRQMEFKKAEALFKAAIAEDASNADLHAWLALTYWRKGEFEAARTYGTKALELDPSSGFAHSVLGRVYNPQFSASEGVDAEKAWQHLIKAVELDPSNGDAWCIIWTEAMRRGNLDMERKSLESLASTKFFTPNVFNYARWTLEQLPENALLITNGDLDTYPMIALQQSGGVRPDVAIVNLSLLNLAWYAELVCERYAMPEPAGLAEMVPHKGDDDKWVLVARQIVEGWRQLGASGDFPRPITVAVTVPLNLSWPEAAEEYRFQGPFFLLNADGDVDIERVEHALAAADALDFGGPTRNPKDTSPLRDGAGVLTNITAAALQLTQAYLDADRPDLAYDTALWAERFEKNSSASPTANVAAYKEIAKKAVDKKKQDKE